MMGNASCLDRHMNSKGESSWEGKVRFPQILLSLLKKKKTKENMRIILWKICMSGKISHSYYCVSQSKLRMGNPITSIRLSERDGLQVCAKICHLKRRDL